MVAPLRVVFLGTPEFAVRTLDAIAASRHVLCGVLTQPDRPAGRGRRLRPSPVKVRALTLDAPMLQPPSLRDPAVLEDVLQAVARWRPDVGVVAAYGQLLPQVLLDLPRLGMVNVHASPIHRAVMDGDHVTGVTIMRVVEALDAGPMLARGERPIDPAETTEDVERDLATLGARLLLEVLDALAADTATETPQDETAATYAPRLTRADGAVDWTRPARAIHNQVRGLHPWPHAFSRLRPGLSGLIGRPGSRIFTNSSGG